MPRIEINPKYCKGCLFCADVCPKDVIGVTDAVNEKGFQFAVPSAGSASAAAGFRVW